MKHLALVLPLLIGGCGAIGERLQPVDSPDTFGRPPIEEVSGDDEAVLEALRAYERQFKEGYPVYPGDRLRFSVLGNPDLSFVAVVPAEGFITFPLIGRVTLVGRTTEQVREELTTRLGQDYLVNPDVSVLVDEYAKKKVFVLGAVKEPKDYELPNGQLITLLQSVALAGGFSDEAEKHQVLLFRARRIGGTERVTLPVNVVGLTSIGKGTDPLVIPNDIIFVPPRERVYVLGQVQHPGAFPIPSDHPVTVTQAISLAGGFTRIASDRGVRLIRKRKDGSRVTYAIDAAKALGGFPEEDAVLQPGDVIFVPESFF